jgi:glycosyltransferase involved in cell wall biosynthesis
MDINLVAAIDSSGYGVVGLNVLLALTAEGHDVAFFPRSVRGNEPVLGLHDTSVVMRALRRQRQLDMDAPCLRISSEDDMTLFAGRGRRCGLAFFDTTGLTDIERRHLGSVDRLFVASGWARGVAIDNGLDPDAVMTVPMGVDRARFSSSPLTAEGPTVFLHVGTWQRRKGQDVLLEAFERAFAPGDQVELRLLAGNPWSGLGEHRWVERCQQSPLRDHITVVPRVEEHSDVAELMRQADCGVFPSRSEAWNLEPLEMLSCGRHVIATDFAGHREFLDRENARLIEIDELEPAIDRVWMPVFGTRKTGDWAHLGSRQVDQLVEHLQAVHDCKQRGALGINEAGIATAERFTWHRTARVLVDGMR